MFPDDRSCFQYLSKRKWIDGFICPKCGHSHYCAGKKEFDRQCTRCNYIESPTSGTLFHKLKFSIQKAFYIIYYVSTNKKGISSTELSRKLALRQKTCWLFKQKVMAAMKSSGKSPMEGNVEVDETFVGGQEEGVVGRKTKSKKVVVFAIERKGKGVQRIYGKVIKKCSAKELGRFMKETIDSNANIKTDEWTGYKPLKSEFPNLTQSPTGTKGGGFPDMHRIIMGFKGWLRGMHHHVNHLQAYIDEYTFRFNRNYMGKGMFENLISKMIQGSPVTYKMIIN